MYYQQGFIKPKRTIPKYYICKCLLFYLSKYYTIINNIIFKIEWKIISSRK